MGVNWKSILKQIAPALATVLGGPAAGMAVKVLSVTLLGKKDGTEAEVETALLNATPEQLLAIKKADQEFAVRMEEIGLDWGKLAVEDVKSARELLRVSIWPQMVLSGVFVAGYFGVLYLVFARVLGEMPEWQQAVLTTILGVLSAAVPQILSFWFGSSMVSARKTAALAASAPALGENGK